MPSSVRTNECNVPPRTAAAASFGCPVYYGRVAVVWCLPQRRRLTFYTRMFRSHAVLLIWKLLTHLTGDKTSRTRRGCCVPLPEIIITIRCLPHIPLMSEIISYFTLQHWALCRQYLCVQLICRMRRRWQQVGNNDSGGCSPVAVPRERRGDGKRRGCMHGCWLKVTVLTEWEGVENTFLRERVASLIHPHTSRRRRRRRLVMSSWGISLMRSTWKFDELFLFSITSREGGGQEVGNEGPGYY